MVDYFILKYFKKIADVGPDRGQKKCSPVAGPKKKKTGGRENKNKIK